MQTRPKTNRTPQISQAIKQKPRMLTDISCRFICSVASEVLAGEWWGRRHAPAAAAPAERRASCHTTAERERRGLNDLRVLKTLRD